MCPVTAAHVQMMKLAVFAAFAATAAAQVDQETTVTGVGGTLLSKPTTPPPCQAPCPDERMHLDLQEGLWAVGHQVWGPRLNLLWTFYTCTPMCS